MRALRQMGRSASATLLLGRRRDHDTAGEGDLEQDEQDEQHEHEHGASQTVQTPLDKTLTKIGFGTYQKKLLYARRPSPLAFHPLC